MSSGSGQQTMTAYAIQYVIRLQHRHGSHFVHETALYSSVSTAISPVGFMGYLRLSLVQARNTAPAYLVQWYSSKRRDEQRFISGPIWKESTICLVWISGSHPTTASERLRWRVAGNHLVLREPTQYDWVAYR